MSEYKTYACDKCGKHQAQHLKFYVDFQDDPCDGRISVPGYADLCPEHLAEAFQTIVKTMPMDKQRELWKSLVSTRRAA